MIEPNYIELTKEQAEMLRGPTDTGAALDPVPLLDGVTWVVPLATLDDPDHAEYHALLNSLPVREVYPGEIASSE